MIIRTLTLGELDTNAYLVSDNGDNTLLIDPADDAEFIISQIHSLGLKLCAVVLTHAHFDHMMAAEAVSEAFSVPLYVGGGDGDAMTDPYRNLSGLFGMTSPVYIERYLTLKETDVLHVGDLSFTVMETPGHTPGCICLRCGDVLFSGDTLFNDSIGRLDFPGGDPAAMLRSLQRLIALPSDFHVYPGHGPATTIGAEIAHNPYLR